MATLFQPDYRLHCRNCDTIIEKKPGAGRGALYCNDDCRRGWRNGYYRRKQAEHRAGVAAKLERLAELERLVAQQ